MSSTVIGKRLLLLRNALSISGGWREISREMFTPRIYKRLITDTIQGRGR
jgi:hypothetical protein